MILESDQKNTLTLEEIQQNTFFFLLAGFDTTSATIAAMLYHLAIDPHAGL